MPEQNPLIPKNKQKNIRISDEILKIAWDNIKIRWMEKSGPCENFSSYLENLIMEDWKKNKENLTEKVKGQKS